MKKKHRRDEIKGMGRYIVCTFPFCCWRVEPPTKFNVFNSPGFISFLLILGIYFSSKKVVLINLTEGKFAVTSVIGTYTKICKLLVHQALLLT